MAKFEFQPFDKVLVRDGENQTWRADFYSHEDATSWPFCCMAGSDWKFCIPYNETTKHLCGTSDPYIDPAEAPAFEFGDVVEIIDSCVKGIYSKSEETYDEVLLKGFVTTRTYKKGNLRLIRKGNFND